MNQINLIGNIGEEPEVKTFASGKKVARIPLAINQYSKAKDKEAIWLDCDCWEELVDRLLKCQEREPLKGARVRVTGSIAVNKYTSRRGDVEFPVKKFYVKVHSFELLGKYQPSEKPSDPAPAEVETPPSDLPFEPTEYASESDM